MLRLLPLMLRKLLSSSSSSLSNYCGMIIRILLASSSLLPPAPKSRSRSLSRPWRSRSLLSRTAPDDIPTSCRPLNGIVFGKHGFERADFVDVGGDGGFGCRAIGIGGSLGLGVVVMLTNGTVVVIRCGFVGGGRAGSNAFW